MKNKFWIIASLISCVWLFITAMLGIIMGGLILAGEAKNLNTTFIFIIMFGCLISSSFVGTSFFNLIKYASRIDGLEDEKMRYWKARKRLEEKISEL